MTEPKIHITSYWNPHFIYDEMATFHDALREYGFSQVTFEPQTIHDNAINILFCGFNLGDDLQKSLRLDQPIDRIIVRNLEPGVPSGPCIKAPSYFSLMKKHVVWDYAEGNIARLGAAGIDRIEYIPVTYMPLLERISPAAEQDIDVLFYGNLSPRRQHVIDQLVNKGINVFTVGYFTSVSLKDLEHLISRSKVILNMANYGEYHIFEIVRVALPLANHKVIVTELNEYSEIDPAIKDAVLHCPYDQLADFCASVVANPDLRKQYETQGYNIFKQRTGTPIIGAAMERYLATQNTTLTAPPPKTYALPKKLRLGSGERWSFDYFNIDADPNVRSDLTLEIGQSIDFSNSFYSWRFGNVQLQEGHFDYINAENVLQSVDNLTTTLKNCLYLLAEDGILEVTVPYYLATSAWLDPKTKRAFNERSFDFLNNTPFKFGEQTFKLQRNHLLHVAESYGIALHAEQQMTIEQISRIPNAIVSLRIKFTKQRINVDTNLHNQLIAETRYYYQ